MIKITILDDDLKELIEYGKNKGKYKKFNNDKKFTLRLAQVYATISSVEKVADLKLYSFLHYEQLKHVPLSSVRIINNRVERLLFKETEDGLEITLIELNEDHYGNKK